MTEIAARQYAESAVSSLQLIWGNVSPEAGDGAQQSAWALAAVAQSQAAVALALLEVADAIRERG